MPITSPYLTSREAAAYCRLSYDHLKDLQARGLTPAIGAGRKGRRVLYTTAALDRWLATRGSKLRVARTA